VTRASLGSRIVRGLLVGLYRLRGWRVEGRAPLDPKFVLVGAPHTSNWDFAIFLGVTDALGIAPNFLGKHSLFKWPLRRFMTDMGGIAVDRSKRSNYVGQVVEEFRRRDSLALVIAPEGSRGSDGRWKSGFYHIAMGAGVPIVPAWIDRRTRRGKIGAAIMPTGDYRADLARIAAFYREAQPGHPRFAMIDRDEAPDDLSNRAHKRLGGQA
jgi:1-acyl-sn-glycerol-3-phosphate acyltransferase